MQTQETSGILLINKPIDYTSRDIVNIVSKKFKTKKVGHTGTLDPLATGVLVITIGKATKLGEILTSSEKEYITEAILGIETDTLDITGKTTKEKSITKTNFNEVINNFNKTYLQEVPIYSAVKVNGKKLYEYARNGEQVELPKKEVNIKKIELLDSKANEIKFKCLVSKGTYIRSLIRDIGLELDTYATMKSLIRTKQGKFKIEDCKELDNFNDEDIIPIEDVLKDYKKVIMDLELEFKVSNGQSIKNIYQEEYILFKSEKVLALYKDDEGILKPFKMF